MTGGANLSEPIRAQRYRHPTDAKEVGADGGVVVAASGQYYTGRSWSLSLCSGKNKGRGDWRVQFTGILKEFYGAGFLRNIFP
jgi:hypothetical protein